MNALKGLLYGFMGTIMAFITIILMYANVPAFHDFVYSSVNNSKSVPQSTTNEKVLSTNTEDDILELIGNTGNQEVADNAPVQGEELVVKKDNAVAFPSNQIQVVSADKYSIGDILQIGDIYTCLTYAKRMDEYPSGLGDKKVGDGNEVLLLFFEVYNSGNVENHLNQALFKGYADNNLVSDTGSFIGITVDGINQGDLAYILDPTTKCMDIVEFEIPKGWSKFNLFYKMDGNEAEWEFGIEQTSTEPYTFNPVINVNVSRTANNVGDVIYDGDFFRITYLGHESEADEDPWFVSGPVYNEYFMFRLENKTDKEQKVGDIAYARGYADNYAMDTVIPIGEKHGDYLETHYVQNLEAGMSVNCFYEFSKGVLSRDSENFYLTIPVTDEGVNGPKAYLYIEE